MAKSLALLSGKGGSGKTSLALSIASMLSKCEIRVLLVDCDLSTNGATYFYEGKLPTKTDKTYSFYSYFFNKYSNAISRKSGPKDAETTMKFVKINDYMDFMPSITKVSSADSYVIGEEITYRARYLHERIRAKYDVILFDCQAGYTDVLKLILPYVDVNLVVMEADAISSAAIRTFYLKAGGLMNEKKMYQVFNKATEEEYNIYSKISGGTVFTNIETVMFDWKIRKAFSTAQIPDMESTSAKYGEQIFSICKIVFNEDSLQEKLNKYMSVVKRNRLTETKNQLEQKLSDLSYERSKLRTPYYRYMILIFLLSWVAALLTLLYKYMFSSTIFGEYYVVVQVLLLMMPLYLFLFVTMLDRSKMRKTQMMQENKIYKDINKLEDEIYELEKEYRKLSKSKNANERKAL